MISFTRTFPSLVVLAFILLGSDIHCMDDIAEVTAKDLTSHAALKLTGSSDLIDSSLEPSNALGFSSLKDTLAYNFTVFKQYDVNPCNALWQSWPITTCAFSPDGSIILLGLQSREIALCEVSTGKKLHILKGHSSFINSVAFSPDGRTVLTGSHDTTARLWDVETGKQLWVIDRHRSTDVSSVAFSPDSKRILIGSEDGKSHLWDIKTEELLREFTIEERRGPVLCVAYSPKGTTVATGGFYFVDQQNPTPGYVVMDYAVRLWNTETGELVQELIGHRDNVTSVAYSPNGKRILTGSFDKTVRLWNTKTGEQLHVFTEHFTVIRSVAFSPDG
nr:WD40 repeat domain-containing protein [Candidatus Dependentiae bacterium]